MTIPFQRRKTKIVATLGPATNSPETLMSILEAGVDICRINCSHSNAQSIRSTIAMIRRCASQLHRSVAILLDLQGPKIRTGTIEPNLHLKSGDILTIVMNKNHMRDGFRIGTTWETMVNDVKPGESVLFADGALSGEVLARRFVDDSHSEQDGKSYNEVDIRMIVGGELKSRKGINLPQSNIQAPALTPKDEHDLAVGVEAGVDYVALSFVRNAKDMEILNQRLSELGYPNTPTIAKIEKPEGVSNIEGILDLASGIMVARGDLGVEIPIEQVPVVQKQLIEAANRKGKLVITATQMLESMTHHPFPTRAEVTDVANAIMDGTDAVMLSGETATGDNPSTTVEMMGKIAKEAENSPYMRTVPIEEIIPLQGKYQSVIRAACYAAHQEDRPLVVFTWSGRTAILASKTRPSKPIYAITPNDTVVDMLRLAYGVYAIKVPQIDSTDELIAFTEEKLMENGLLKRGDEVIILGGNAPMRGASNLMKIEIIDGTSH